MSYLQNNTALGGIAVLGSALQDVAEDPCLFEVAALALELHALEQPSSPGSGPPSPPTKGVGLCGAVKPLNAVIYLKQNKWVLPAAGAALFLGLFGLGYFTGRKVGRRSR